MIRIDNATRNKDRMQFARVLVEMDVNHGFPDMISFTSEDEELINIKVEYDWKPQVCTKCKLLGHLVNSYKAGTTQEWVPKTVPDPPTCTNGG